ncbi:aldolase/citrate lyase family protein [Paucibacter sp. AS339]|uniref:aldolase/citrate lyase family protein n=1 Tax=Paucibacter hankyongi TaxID=3133434 RepID=UPI00309686FB
MSMRLLYITKDPAVGQVAQRAGVDWIFVDLEYLGKKDRQANRDTVISTHTLDDVRAMREVVTTSQLMVRINPWGAWSSDEITDVIAAGADIIMLPFFSTAGEVKDFIVKVGGRAKTCLLLETLTAIEVLDDILAIPGIDFVHIGLNDLHIERGTTFMFEFLADGGVDRIAAKLRNAGITFGFGGMARIGGLVPPAERILAEHFRLGSTGVILSRSFCHPSQATGTEDFEEMFQQEVEKIREQERTLVQADAGFFEHNRRQVIDEVAMVVNQMKEKLG